MIAQRRTAYRRIEGRAPTKADGGEDGIYNFQATPSFIYLYIIVTLIFFFYFTRWADDPESNESKRPGTEAKRRRRETETLTTSVRQSPGP